MARIESNGKEIIKLYGNNPIGEIAYDAANLHPFHSSIATRPRSNAFQSAIIRLAANERNLKSNLKTIIQHHPLHQFGLKNEAKSPRLGLCIDDTALARIQQSHFTKRIQESRSQIDITKSMKKINVIASKQYEWKEREEELEEEEGKKRTKRN